jgi:excisionase family DNA binding protein
MSILKTLRERKTLLNVAELAKLLCVTEATVQRWGRKRQIPTIRIGDVIRFCPEKLADWIESQGVTITGGVSALFRRARAAEDSDFKLRWQDLGNIDPANKGPHDPEQKK